MENCYIHPRFPGIHVCEYCQSPICELCRAKETELVLCYLCLTKLEDKPVEPAVRTPSALDQAFPDVTEPGWKGEAAAIMRGGILGLTTTCVVAPLWGLFESFTGRTSPYVWGVVGIPVGLAIRLGTGSRNGMLPVTIGIANGLVLVFIRTAVLVFHAASTDQQVGRLFRRMAPWEQAGVVILGSVRSFINNPGHLFLMLVCLFVTAGVATGGQLRRPKPAVGQ